METHNKGRRWERYHTSKQTQAPKHDPINTRHFPHSARQTHIPLYPPSHCSHPLPPSLCFLSTVVSSHAAKQKAAGTIELTHASFPLPALCFPYGNPLWWAPAAGSGSERVRAERQHKNNRAETTTQLWLWSTNRRNLKLLVAVSVQVLAELAAPLGRILRKAKMDRYCHSQRWRSIAEPKNDSLGPTASSCCVLHQLYLSDQCSDSY